MIEIEDPALDSSTVCRRFYMYVVLTSTILASQGAKCVLVSPIPVTKFRMFSIQASFMPTQPRVFCSLILPSLDLSSNYSMPFVKGVCFGIWNCKPLMNLHLNYISAHCFFGTLSLATVNNVESFSKLWWAIKVIHTGNLVIAFAKVFKVC